MMDEAKIKIFLAMYNTSQSHSNRLLQDYDKFVIKLKQFFNITADIDQYMIDTENICDGYQKFRGEYEQVLRDMIFTPTGSIAALLNSYVISAKLLVTTGKIYEDEESKHKKRKS